MSFTYYCSITFLVVVTFTHIHGTRVDFYEHSNYKGTVLRINVDSTCMNMPPGWDRYVSSLKTWGCVSVFMDVGCRGSSKNIHDLDVQDLGTVWTVPKRYQHYWKNTDWNDKILSYRPCKRSTEKDKVREVATSYLQDVHRRTISVDELRAIAQDSSSHTYTGRKH